MAHLVACDYHCGAGLRTSTLGAGAALVLPRLVIFGGSTRVGVTFI